jgi:hypothetical protein
MALAIAFLIGYIPMLFWAVSELRPPKKRRRKDKRKNNEKQPPWGDPKI